jgi:uncharacterized damage-inducible protein DinB
MQNELAFIRSQIVDAWSGSPWFGKSAKALLSEVNEEVAFQKPNDQHSALELLWHIITWREFVIDRLQHSPQMRMEYFDKNNWRPLDHADISLWNQGLERLSETQNELLALLDQKDDSILDKQVAERDYNFRYLLHGIVQHDAYHLGQIAYITKLKKNIQQMNKE